MNKISIAFLAITSIFISQNLSAQEAFISNKLEKTWEVTEGLSIPESSHYNAFDKTIYVSNIVGKHNIKDSVGYISKVNEKGKMVMQNWVTGLKAPKGIDCTKDKLYVTDIDRVVEVDLKTGKIIKEYRNAKSKSLNDVSIAADGRVYVSDSDGNCIFYVGKDSLELFLESAELKSMNGILAKGNQLYLGSKGNFICVDQTSKAIKILAEKVGYLDGIEQIAEGKFITSDFGGKVQLIEIGKGTEVLLHTTPIKINAADIGYISKQKIVLVPTFNHNGLVAYKLNIR
jgi:outer membrane protein assembly factor BamB